MKILLALASLMLLHACSSGGLPPPDWKTDASDLVERYKKHALQGDNVLAERYFQQAIAATGSAGRVADTARLWLVRCATRRAMLIDDACSEYSELATVESHPADRAYYQFITLRWDNLDTSQLPRQHQDLVKSAAGKRHEAVSQVADPLARLLGASLLVMRQEARAETLALATETASSRGWTQPLLTYLKLMQQQAADQGQAEEAVRLARRVELVEKSLLLRTP